MIVTVEQDTYPPRVKIETAGEEVYRTIGDVTVQVRGLITDGVVYDYECPQALDATYNDGLTTSAPVQMPSVGDWLIHPGFPELSSRIVVRRMGAIGRPSNTATFEPIGAEAIAVSFPRGARRGSLLVNTYDAEREAELEALLDDGSTLFLSTNGCFGLPSCYLSIGDVDRDARTRWGTDEARVWSLPYLVIKRPTFVVSTTVTWSDLASTWGGLGSSWDTITEG